MIKPVYSKWGRFFWKNYCRSNIKLDFREMLIPYKPEPDPDKSIFLLSNHLSWWDGFWGYHLNDLLWGKRFHVMMLEEHLKTRQLLCHGGAYSIHRGGRAMVESLRFTADLLNDPENLVLLFPQGKIHSQHSPDMEFQQGSTKILKWTQKPVQVIFGASFVDYFQHRKPSLYYFLEEWEGDVDRLSEDFSDFYRRMKEEQGKKWV